MDGSHLTSVQTLIGQLQSEGRAIESDVEHSYTVLEVTTDAAKVADTYVSNSVYVSPLTHAVLSQPTGDNVRELYDLNRIGGTWKVVKLAKIQ
jgi:hypothetical protein